MVDLASEDWPLLNPLQVSRVHSSPVSCLAHFPSVPQNIWIKIDFVRRKAAKNHLKVYQVLMIMILMFLNECDVWIGLDSKRWTGDFHRER